MRIFLLSLLIVSVVGLFIELWIVFNNTRNLLHKNLLLSCLAILVNTVGYMLELLSTTKEQCITAIQFSYFGRVWIAFLLFKFAVELCHIKLPFLIRKILPVIHVVVYGTILMIPHNDLYYKNIEYVTDGLFPVLRHGDGPFHHLLIQLQMVYIVCVFYWLIRDMVRKKNPSARRRALIVFLGIAVESALYVIQISKILDVTRYFDLTIFGYVVLTFFMYIAILRCNLLGIIDMNREFMIDKVTEAVIGVNELGKVEYYNDMALSLFPALVTAPESVTEKISSAIANGETITVRDRIYMPDENEVTDGTDTLGKLYTMVDSTELKQNEYKLKADAEILEMAAKSMKDRLASAEELMKQDRAMRHDRRHFEALLMTLLEEGKVDEAKKCISERLEQEPHMSVRYCENTTVNAALTHYVSLAEKSGIKTTVHANIPFEPGVDDMQLAIAVSNLLENAVHACEAVPEEERFINLTAKYKKQLLIEISNSCKSKVSLDNEGHPFTTKENHGIGTRSVLAFVDQTGSEIRYIAEDNIFKVRMIIGA